MIINLLIVLLILYGAYQGYHRGFIAVIADLAGLVLAITVAAVLYRPVAHFISVRFKVIPSFGDAIGYLLIVGLVEIIYIVCATWLLRFVPKEILHSHLNRLSGAAANAVRATIFIMIGLVIFAALPLTASQKHTITSATISRWLLSYSGSLQQAFNRQFGGAINDSINFFTVEPESNKTVELGFTTTNVKVDQVNEERMLVLVNKERISRGFEPLVMNRKATEVARSHSRDMFARGYFSHITPEGVNPFQRMESGEVKFGAAGENLALAPTLNLAHNGLMNSPGHRANILSPNYRAVGIGVIDGGPYGLMITQNFTD
jgi:uncharacterized protein YkwD